VTRHRIGFAVKVLGDGGLPSHDTRRWQSGPHLRVSLERLAAILQRLDAIDVRMYRMATSLAPYASHPDMPRFHHQVEECAEQLAAIGARARALGIRLSTHPGQHTVLNSVDERVQAAAVADLEVQAALLDALGLGPEAVVVVHVGGAAGGILPALDRFARGYELLSDRARARLVVENDDRSFAIAHVLSLHGRLGMPVVWDILHHHCHDPARIPPEQALELALGTWPVGVTPKIHYASPRLDMGERPPQLRAHADLIDPIGFESFLLNTTGVVSRDFDIMLEAKGKDLALLRLREQLRSPRIAYERGMLTVASPGLSALEMDLSGAELGAAAV
jgi:UV DNA damage endonuclease